MDFEHIKTQILKHLKGGEAFMPMEKVLEKFDFHTSGFRMHDLPYSAYEIFYHITYAQKDILNFCKADTYSTPDWPNDYWPARQSPRDEKEWQELKKSYFEDREELAGLVTSPDSLTQVVKNGDSQTLFRELLLVIEHTAYHTGQLVVLSRLLL